MLETIMDHAQGNNSSTITVFECIGQNTIMVVIIITVVGMRVLEVKPMLYVSFIMQMFLYVILKV